MNWRTIAPKDDCEAWSIEDENGATICELSFTNGDEERIARMIASAPRMYSACIAHDMDEDTTTWINESVQRIPREE